MEGQIVKDDDYYRHEITNITKKLEKFLKELREKGYEYTIQLRDQNTFDTYINHTNALDIEVTKLEYTEKRKII